MKRFFSALLIAVGLSSISLPSLAITDTALNLTSEYTFTGGQFDGSFLDRFTFSFKKATGTQATFDFGFSDIAAASYALVPSSTQPASFQPLNLQDALGIGAFSATSEVHTLTPNVQYSLFVSGRGTGDGYTVTVTPVPEPGEWAMMLSGLALLGLIARRRTSRPTIS